MPAIKHTEVFGAVSKSLGENRGTAFRENPTEETRDAILDVVEENLNELIKKHGKSKKKK